MSTIEKIAIFYIVWNVVVFFTYGLDKRKSKYNKWRISEKALIMCAFLMGAFGAIWGMKVFRHKTNHLKFKICVPLALIINLIIIFKVEWGKLF